VTGVERSQLGRRTRNELDRLETLIVTSMGNGNANKKDLIRAVIVQKGREGEIWQLLEPGREVAWVNG
jgi:hypothetical protein